MNSPCLEHSREMIMQDNFWTCPGDGGGPHSDPIDSLHRIMMGESLVRKVDDPFEDIVSDLVSGSRISDAILATKHLNGQQDWRSFAEIVNLSNAVSAVTQSFNFLPEEYLGENTWRLGQLPVARVIGKTNVFPPIKKMREMTSMMGSQAWLDPVEQFGRQYTALGSIYGPQLNGLHSSLRVFNQSYVSVLNEIFKDQHGLSNLVGVASAASNISHLIFKEALETASFFLGAVGRGNSNPAAQASD